MNTQSISLDLAKGRTGEHVVIAQGDTAGTTIVAEIFDNGTALDLTGCTACFLMMQPDRMHYARDATPTCSGNVITYVVDEEAIAGVSGYTDECYFEIAIPGGEKVVSTQRFSMEILRDVMADRTPGANYDSKIAEILETLENAPETIADASAATARATSAAESAEANSTLANQAATLANAKAGLADAKAVLAEEAASSASGSAVRAEAATAAALAAVADAQEAIEQIGDISELAVPLASKEVRGGAKIGYGLKITDGFLHVDPTLQLPEYDDSTNRYDNASIKNWLDMQRENKVYTVKIPKFSYSSTVDCEKTDANAGMTVVPSTATEAGQDDYKGHLAFDHWEVNGGADADGSPFATKFQEIDADYARDGSTGNVWQLAPVLYYRITEDENFVYLSVCDTERSGFKLQPGALLPDGSVRPYMLYAKYAGGTYDGKLASVSGVKLRNRDVSHNSLITQAHAVGDGYSGKSFADDWYIKVMFLLKYAKKSSQAVFAGCSGYTTQTMPTVSETGVKRVVVSNSAAASLEVGSACMLGNQASSSTDRNNVNCYNVFDGLTIVSKEAYDAGNTAVYFDSDATFDVETTYRLSTAPWPCGCLDSVLGSDGTLTTAGRTNSREPFLLQGIECMLGVYEVVGDVILNALEEDSTLKVEVLLNYDSLNEATSLTSDYIDTGISLPTSETAGWLYCGDFADAGGFLVLQTSGASTTTGFGDGHYQNVATSKGLREFLGLGNLDAGGVAGLWCVISYLGLGNAWWYVGSRLSVTGRTAAPAEVQG